VTPGRHVEGRLPPGGDSPTGRIAVVLAGCAAVAATIFYPFLPGRYDALAAAMSTAAQLLGVAGLALVPAGALWLLKPRRGRLFVFLTMAVGTVVVLLMVLAAASVAGAIAGVGLVAAWVVLGRSCVSRRASADDREAALAPTAALCFVVLPLVALSAQVLLAKPAADLIARAGALIDDIEQFRLDHGRYPASLQAQNRDYDPGVVGVAGYVYVPQGDTYNLSFEMPRFLLWEPGAREWVVYNPRDEHRSYSHVAWLFVPDDRLAQVQGWYRATETGVPHWRSFLFD
jgi:hypothetical protein